MTTTQEIYKDVIKNLPTFHQTYEMGTKRYLQTILKILIWIAWRKARGLNQTENFLAYMGVELDE
jgi:hypothetical protein